MRMKRSYGLFGITLLILAFGGATFWLYAPSVEDAERPRERDEVGRIFGADVLRAYAQEHGSVALRDYVFTEGERFTTANGHYIGHALGGVLYEREGLDALGLCGASFTYGCVHEVIGHAYAAQGPESLWNLTEECRSTLSNYGECLHALGHALVDVYGYDTAEEMEKSLAICETTVKPGQPLDFHNICYAGVFMEFNTHIMAEGAFAQPRPYDEAEPYAPCDAIRDDRQRSICSFWLVSWIHGILYDFRYNDDVFKRLGDYCYAMPDTTMRSACVYAVGGQIGIRGDIPYNRSMSFCDAAVRPEDKDECVMGMARMVRGSGRMDRVTARCEALGDRKEECIAFADPPNTQ